MPLFFSMVWRDEELCCFPAGVHEEDEMSGVDGIGDDGTE